MTQTTLDFSPTFQLHHTTATLIIMPYSSMPLSLTLHHHHYYYPLIATNSNSFIINIIIIIHHPLIALDDHNHLHQHNKELPSHTKQGHKQAQGEVDDKVKRIIM
uniref:Uncharacterized protein n=2 Tax=Glycine subgen. Soja TaxID=1462606 RepID=A0A0R0JJ17_SOYBN